MGSGIATVGLTPLEDVMNTLTLRFGKSENIAPGDYHVVYRFPFSAIDSELIGSPEEARMATSHRLVVKITPSRRAGWRVSESELRKELFEIGLRVIVEKAKRGNLSADEQVVVNTSTHSSTLPFDSSRIVEPDGAMSLSKKSTSGSGSETLPNTWVETDRTAHPTR